MSAVEILAALVVGHCLADYPLQGDFLSRAKNHRSPVEGVPWWMALAAHSIIHGGIVWAVTGSLLLGVVETLLHAYIDWSKCEGLLDFRQDQLLHALCKIMYVPTWWLLTISAG